MNDFTVHGVSNIEVCRWIAENLDYDQHLRVRRGWLGAATLRTGCATRS